MNLNGQMPPHRFHFLMRLILCIEKFLENLLTLKNLESKILYMAGRHGQKGKKMYYIVNNVNPSANANSILFTQWCAFARKLEKTVTVGQVVHC